MSEGRQGDCHGGEVVPDGVQCIVLVGRVSRQPESLVEALKRCGADVRVVFDAPGVIPELANHQRGTLIVYEPHRIQHLSELLVAVGRYFPSVRCREFCLRGGKSRPHLAELAVDDLSTDLDAELSAQNLGDSTATPTDESASPLISEEELAMLIGPLEHHLGDDAAERAPAGRRQSVRPASEGAH